MSPKLKVEINFTGAAWVEVTNSAGTGGVTDYLRLAQGVSISEGRENEAGDAVSPGTCSLVLDNSDGRFSSNLPSSPYYPNVNPGAGLRVSGWVNGAWQSLFQGKIQAWSADSVNDPTGKAAVSRVTASDTLGVFPSYTLRQASDEIIRNTAGLLNHWSLQESGSPAVARAGAAQLVDNGKDGWGKGSQLALDEGTDKHPLFVSSSTGLKLSTTGLSVPGYSRVRLVVFAAPTAAGNLLTVQFSGYGGTTLAIAWSATLGFTATDPTFGTVSTGLPTSWPQVLEVGVWLTPRIGIRSCGLDGTQISVGMSYNGFGTLQGIVINPTLSGAAQWSSAHLAVFSGASTSADLIAYAAALLVTSRIPPLVSAPQQLSTFAGGPTVNGATVGETALPLLEGRDAAEAMGALINGMGARLVDNHNGTLKWVPFAPATTPVPIPAGALLNDLGWRNDSSGWCSDVTVTWPDATTYTGTRPDGERKTLPLEGVHATRALDIVFADWQVTNASNGARCPAASVNLLHPLLTDPQRAALSGAIPGTRLSLTPGLAFMPASLLEMVEGRDVTIDHQQWLITFKMSPDVNSFAFTLDDATYGVLDAGNFLAA